MTDLTLSLIDHLSRPIAVVERDGSLSYRNRAFRDYFGAGADEWIRGGTKGIGGSRGWLEDFFETSQDPHETEVAFSGRTYSVCQISIPESATQVALSFDDITRQQETEQARSDFTSMIVHDLRGPLSGIQGAVEFVLEQEETKLGALISDLLQEASHEAQRMMNLVDELLDFSKIQSGNFVLETAPVHPAGVLKRAVRSLQPAAARAGITLISAHGANLPVVQSNSEKLTQALINLLSNALKFTPAGGVVAVSATVASHNGLNDLIISVTDTGIGVKPEDQARLFQKYKQSRGKSFRGGGGTGLGLYIVKQIVEAHGGRISLSSLEGKGTSIAFSIPAGKESSASARTPGVEQRSPSS